MRSLESAWERLDPSGAPMLKKWMEEARERRPYEGIRIFHNLPLSVETVCKVHALKVAGADVVVACTDFLIPASFDAALEMLEEAGIEVRPGKEIEKEEFDYFLDCCAELAEKSAPKRGVVELTRTGALIYEDLEPEVPILSVDDSCLKALETFYGTGDGFLRAFTELTGEDVKTHHFLLVGYGKVGQGVAYSLQQAGALVSVADASRSALKKAQEEGFSIGEANQLVDQATVVVTATGLPGVLQQVFHDADQQLGGKILANIGADDEIGEGFAHSRILANRMPINFALEYPTIMRYLDPSFLAHNLGIQLIEEGGLEKRFHSFPQELDHQIVEEWSRLHGESVERILVSTSVGKG